MVVLGSGVSGTIQWLSFPGWVTTTRSEEADWQDRPENEP
jgi:hypothetical protein